MRVSSLIALSLALICENCLNPPVPRLSPTDLSVVETLWRLISHPTLDLTLIEAKMVLNEMGKDVQTQEDVVNLVFSGRFVRYLGEWRRKTREKLASDYGEMVFREDLQGLFSPATYSLLYTHPSSLASPLPFESELPSEDPTDDFGHCDEPMNFRYHFPRK